MLFPFAEAVPVRTVDCGRDGSLDGISTWNSPVAGSIVPDELPQSRLDPVWTKASVPNPLRGIGVLELPSGIIDDSTFHSPLRSTSAAATREIATTRASASENGRWRTNDDLRAPS